MNKITSSKPKRLHNSNPVFWTCVLSRLLLTDERGGPHVRWAGFGGSWEILHSFLESLHLVLHTRLQRGGKSIMKTTEPAGITDGSEDVLTEGSAGEISCITHPRRKKQEQKNLWPVLCPWTSVWCFGFTKGRLSQQHSHKVKPTWSLVYPV